MDYIFFVLLSLISSSWDKWLGDILFYSFPIILCYIKSLYNKENGKNLMVFTYGIFYFASKNQIGVGSVVFFLVYVFVDILFSEFQHNFISIFSYFLVFNTYLAFMNNSLESFFVGMLIFTVLYFINMRLIAHD